MPMPPFIQRLTYQAHEIPTWLQAPYIHRGYRFNVSFMECAKSIFYLHNETISIWTHLIPSLIFAGLAIKFAFVPQPQYDNKIFVRLCSSFAVVFGASAFMHTFNPIDEQWYLVTTGLDWAAIALAVMAGGSTLAGLAYHDNRKRQAGWYLAFAVSCTIVAIVVSSGGAFHYLPSSVKVSVLSLPGAVFVAFFLDIRQQLSPKDLATMIELFNRPTLLLISGIVVYASRFPEAQFLDIDFSISRGHHLYHHFWSVVFSFWFLRNALKRAKEIYFKNKKRVMLEV